MEESESEQVKWVKRGSPKVKCKRDDKKKKKKKKKKKHGASRVEEVDASQGGSESKSLNKKKKKHAVSFTELREQLNLEHAKMALEFYEKSEDDAEFEILRVLYSSYSRLQHPDSESAHLWFHVSFIAKPRKADRNISPTNFFGELFRDRDSGRTHVMYCSTFQPSDDPGFDHGCTFCPLGEKLHPSDGYCVGRPPWHKEKRVCGRPPWVRGYPSSLR